MIAPVIASLVKLSLVLGLALAAMPLMKRRSAAFRHWVLAAALACAAGQPMFSLAAPRWALPSMPWRSSAAEAAVETSLSLRDVDAGVRGQARSSEHVPAMSFSRALPAGVLFGVWIGGALFSLGSLAVGLTRLARITARAHEASDVWLAAARAVGRALQLRALPLLRVTDHPALLVMWGVRRPVVLLPRDAGAWPMDRICAVLGHELAHAQRRDWVTQLGAEILRALCWFHPLVWLACARLRQESEQACDDLVLSLGVERTAYASHLVAIARAFKMHRRVSLPAPAIAWPGPARRWRPGRNALSPLQWRIRAMLNRSLDRRPVSAWTRAAILVVMLCASVSIAGLHAQAPSVSGTLRDPSGLVLSGAAVRLADPQSDAKYDAVSDASGQFQFSAVAPGSYVLSARHLGFSPSVETLAITAGGSVRRELTLQVASLQESILVRGGSGADEFTGRRRQEVPFAMPACTSSQEGGQIIPPTKVRHVPPHYPRHLQDAGVTGTVLLVAHVGPDGVVNDVRPFSISNPGLEEAAIVAVTQWRFTPTLLNCQPIPVQMLATVKFSL